MAGKILDEGKDYILDVLLNKETQASNIYLGLFKDNAARNLYMANPRLLRSARLACISILL